MSLNFQYSFHIVSACRMLVEASIALYTLIKIIVINIIIIYIKNSIVKREQICGVIIGPLKRVRVRHVSVSVNIDGWINHSSICSACVNGGIFINDFRFRVTNAGIWCWRSANTAFKRKFIFIAVRFLSVIVMLCSSFRRINAELRASLLSERFLCSLSSVTRGLVRKGTQPVCCRIRHK